MLGYFSLLFFSLFPKPGDQNVSVDGLPIQEALEMVSLCNTFSFSRYYNNSNAFVPFDYRWKASTNETPLHNAVRIYKKHNTLVLIFRGTVDESNSWLENLHFMQVPAQEKIYINEKPFDYRFSVSKGAAVHSGYVLAVLYLWQELQPYLLPEKLLGVDKIILAGHSQGGALAQMFLAQMSLMDVFEDIALMSYSFGSPRIGNQQFSDDFNKRFAKTNRSFRFINPADLVCQLPIVNKRFDLDVLGLQASIDLDAVNSLLQFGKELLPEDDQEKIDKTIQKTLLLADFIVKEQVADVDFPDFSSTIFYGETGKIIKLDKQPYPDYLQLKIDNSFSSIWDKFNQKKETLRRELTFYQHSIFTYYNAIHDYCNQQNIRRIRMPHLPQKMI